MHLLDVCLIIDMSFVRFGLGFAHDAISILHITCSCIFHAYVFFSFSCSSCDVCVCVCVFLFYLFIYLFFPDRLRMAPKCKFTLAQNPFGSGSSTSDPPIPTLHVRFRDGKAQQDFLENFQKRGIHPKRHVVLSDFSDTFLPDAIWTRGWDSLCEKPLRRPIVFIQEFYSNIHGIDTFVPLFATKFRGTCIVVTPNLISKVLHVLRVVHPDYLGCECLRTASRDELLFHFCETPSIWGGKQNTPYSSFAKGSRFVNMVITFVLIPLSHYNFIIEPHACFLLSLL